MEDEGRTFAIGDVHGCLGELKALVARIQPTSQDRLIFLGDLVNRGPDSAGVIRYVRQLRNRRCLMGNHERRLLAYRRTGDASILKSYDVATIESLEPEDWDFIDNFDLFLEVPRAQAVFVHGGFLPWLPWYQQPEAVMLNLQVVEPATRLWGKRTDMTDSPSWQNFWEGPPFVICGHTPRLEVFRRPWSMCIDTACVYGGKLTACNVNTLELIQVPAYLNYVERR